MRGYSRSNPFRWSRATMLTVFLVAISWYIFGIAMSGTLDDGMHELEKREAKMREERERSHLDDFRRRSSNQNPNMDFDDDDTDRDYDAEFENDINVNDSEDDDDDPFQDDDDLIPDDDGDNAAYDDLDDDDDDDDAVVNENIYKDAAAGDDGEVGFKDNGWSRSRGNDSQHQEVQLVEQTKHYQMTNGVGDNNNNLFGNHSVNNVGNGNGWIQDNAKEVINEGVQFQDADDNEHQVVLDNDGDDMDSNLERELQDAFKPEQQQQQPQLQQQQQQLQPEPAAANNPFQFPEGGANDNESDNFVHREGIQHNDNFNVKK